MSEDEIVFLNKDLFKFVYTLVHPCLFFVNDKLFLAFSRNSLAEKKTFFLSLKKFIE